MKLVPSREIVTVCALLGGLVSMCLGAEARPSSSFQPIVRRVRVLPARPVDVFDGYDTRVVVEFDARGSVPKWWREGTEFEFHHRYSSGKVVRVEDGKPISLGQRGYIDAPHPDSKSRRWRCAYNLKLRDFNAVQRPLRLRDTIRFESQKVWAKVWLDVPIRAKEITTEFPSVSRVPSIKLEDFRFMAVPPRESQGRHDVWRVRWTIINNVDCGDSSPVSGTDIHIVNSKGVDVDGGGTMYGFSEFKSEFGQTAPGYSLKSSNGRRFGFEDFWLGSKVTKSEPLWLRGSIRCGEKWPLAINIPIRDARGQMLFTSRSPSMP